MNNAWVSRNITTSQDATRIAKRFFPETQHEDLLRLQQVIISKYNYNYNYNYC